MIDSLILEQVLDYRSRPCLWNPSETELDFIERKRLRDLGYFQLFERSHQSVLL